MRYRELFGSRLAGYLLAIAATLRAVLGACASRAATAGFLGCTLAPVVEGVGAIDPWY
jgi:hypothetical protein